MKKATYNATDYDEPDEDPDYFARVVDVASGNTIVVAQMFCDKHHSHKNKNVGDAAGAYESRKAHENGLPDLLNLVDPLVHAKYPRQSSQEENQSAKNDDVPDRDDRIVAEVLPRQVRAVPQENGDIEEIIDCRLQGVIFGL